MAVAIGSQLGSYEITALLGKGGFGEVYKARDTRLNRIVAVKVLAPEFAARPDWKQRFEREARTIASLNHPHICVLHDIGHRDGTDFLVIEYLDGETLAQRLENGPIPLDQALKIAIEMTDALDKAHRQGIVHRDLKPGNVMLTQSGVKLLDFGLAKPNSRPQSNATASAVPTAGTLDLTEHGAIVGTLQYMAPEQLEGEEADARSDIFALGAVLYEMTTGRKAFSGKSQASLIASILKEDPPPIAAVQPLASASLDHVVRSCLDKSLAERWQSASDLLRELRWIAESPEVSIQRAATPRSRRAGLIAAASVVLLILTLVLSAVLYLRKPAQTAPVRFSILPPSGYSFTASSSAGVSAEPWPMLSPDGRRLVFVATSESGKQQLWIRPLDSAAAQILPGTEDAVVPFWAPDSRFVGFFAQGKLKKVDTWGGAPQIICDGGSGVHGGTWSADGTILFSGDGPVLLRTTATGGKPVPVTELDKDRKEGSHLRPYFLPDGKSYLFIVTSAVAESRGVYLGTIGSKQHALLINSISDTRYSPSGHLLYQREGVLFAHRFDLRNSKLIGEPVVIADRVANAPNTGSTAFSVSTDGILAYRGADSELARRMIWVDPSGNPIGEPLATGNFREVSLSPDGRRIAYSQTDGTGNTDIWILDLIRKTNSKVTFDPKSERMPIWLPDGSGLIYSSNQLGTPDLFQIAADRTDQPKLIMKSAEPKVPFSISADGHLLLYMVASPKTKLDIWAVDIAKGENPKALVQTSFTENEPRISPDMKWFAYSSDESGRSEIYIQPLPQTGRKWLISTAGGTEPRFRGDSKELYYLDTNGFLNAVGLHLGASVEAGAPRRLFRSETTSNGVAAWSYDVTPDGKRFLLNAPAGNIKEREISVVLNWPATLK
jgi:serine/threonine protein kinase